MLEMPVIDVDKCNGCGICVAACHCSAILIFEGKAVIVETQLCGWCTVCEAVCPLGALMCPYEIVFDE